MWIEELNHKVHQIEEELKAVYESVNSAEKRKEKIAQIKEKAEKTKQELEVKINSLKDKTKEEAQALLDSLNEMINFKLTLWDNNKAWEQTTQPSPSDNKSVFTEAKDWIWEQRDDVWNKDKRKFNAEWWKNLLRTVWFLATWAWAVALAFKWVKKLWNWAFSKDKKKKKAEWKEKQTEENEE